MMLRTKIPLLLIPLIVTPLLLLGWSAYTQLREAGEERIFAEMRTTLDHIEAHMDTEADTARGNIDLLAKQSLVKKYVLTEDDEERYSLLLPALLRLFSSYQEAFPEYYEMRILLPDGYEDVRHTRPYIENLSDEEGGSQLFERLQAARGEVYTSVFRNPDNNRMSLFVGKPMILRNPPLEAIDAEPTLRGYLGLTIDISKVESHIGNDIIGASGYLFATDGTGKVVFESSEKSPGRAIPENLLEDFSGFENGSLPRPVSFNGTDSYILGTRLLPDLYAYAVLPTSELRAIAYQIARVVIAITIVAIVVMMLFVMAVMEYFIIRPIRLLSNHSKEIGRGNWSVEVAVTEASDEIGALANSLSEMSGNLRQSDEQVRFLAYHDSLTGLPNRTMFKEYLGRSIALAKRKQQQLAVLFLDVDNFKKINDTLGHQAGDTLLREVADRLTTSLREADFVAREHLAEDPNEVVARLGGDEFIVLLPDIEDARSAVVVAERIIDVIGRPIMIGDQECHVSVSIGITVYPSDGQSIDQLIRNADIAMYHAKDEGRNTFHYFQESMNEAVMDRLRIESRLRRAIANSEFTLHYQPQVDAVTHDIVGLEALLRWEDPEEGLIPPYEFIGLAEKSGLILPIGEWVIHEVCRQARDWQDAGCLPGSISLNVSAVQFARQDIGSIIKDALATNGLDACHLDIEITESAVMPHPERALEILDEIRALGVGIALDDFGTGYSSLSYLRRLPVTALKIDRGFILEIDKKKEDAEIVGTIAAMAHILGLRVVVEGVETLSQLNAVTQRQCDLIQGYYFSRPLPVDEITHLLTSPKLEPAACVDKAASA